MSTLRHLLDSPSLAACPQAAAAKLAQDLSYALGLDVYPRSIVACNATLYCLGRRGRDKRVCALAQAKPQGWAGERSNVEVDSIKLAAVVADTSPAHAALLRKRLPFTAPQLVAGRKSLGTGDRLGLATPAHVQAVRGTGVTPIFAQQSIREMTRSHRTAQQVMDSASWGVLQEGWIDPWGSDADHLKTTDDIDLCLAAGFTMFTIDPGEHVDDEADALDAAALAQRFERLPWDALESTAADCRRGYIGRAVDVGGDMKIQFDETALLRSAAKYGRAVAHSVRMHRHLVDKAGDRPFELEVSVDETATRTRIEEHFYIATELRRLGVQWASLAPRFVGEFEKGVDYKGDLGEFERTFIQHVALARRFGPYKISLHSGSDKFSVYPIAAKRAGDWVHVKTAGTSYLEALRTIATVEPALMREILDFARSRYEEDKASYHVSADLAKVPAAAQLDDDELPALLDQFDSRQVLHVTYGSVLTEERDSAPVFKPRIIDALETNEDAHYEIVARHLRRHAEPFARSF